MNKFTTLFNILLPFNSFSLFAQVDKKFMKPDYTAIKTTISDKASENYYPALFARYQKNDSTLTQDQYRLLYFGYAFQD